MDRTAESRLPYSSHPLYAIRKTLLITAVIGIFLDLVAIAALGTYASDHIPLFLIAIVLLFCSIAFVSHDLISYAVRHARTPPETTRSQTPSNITPTTNRQSQNQSGSPWPSKRHLITDLVLAIFLQWLFWVSFFGIIAGPRSYYGSGAETFEAYANLANFVASFAHARAFWKELIARKRAAWERERAGDDVEARVCVGCGTVAGVRLEGEAEARGGPGHEEEEEVGMGEGGVHEAVNPPEKGKTRLPKWATELRSKLGTNSKDADGENDAAIDGPTATEPLLATPDESSAEIGGPSTSPSNYGTLDQSVESVRSVPETVVRKKDKGKKRLVDVE